MCDEANKGDFTGVIRSYGTITGDKGDSIRVMEVKKVILQV